MLPQCQNFQHFQMRPKRSHAENWAVGLSFHLLSHRRILQSVERFVEHAGALVHIDHHARLAMSAEVTLEQSRQPAVAKRHYQRLLSAKENQ